MVKGSTASDAAQIAKPHIVKFVEVNSSGNATYSTLDFENEAKYVFDYDGTLRLDVSDVHTAGAASGTMTFRNKFTVENDTKVAQGSGSGSVVLYNRLEDKTDVTTGKVTMRTDTKDHKVVFC